MPSFAFRTVPRIVVAWDGAGRLGEIVGEQLAPCRLLVITDAGLTRAGLTDAPRASLEAAGFAPSETQTEGEWVALIARRPA